MNNNFKLIGLYGYSRSGKDEIAKFLVKNHGFERRAFADSLRKVLFNILEAQGGSMFNYIEHYGWEITKKDFPKIVDMMIALGAGMRELNSDIWIPGVFNGDYPQHLVISDVRHPNEAEAVWDAGGELWKVTRPGTQPRAMDTMLENWQFDRHIENTGTLGDLERKVNAAWYLHFKNTPYPHPLGRIMCECGWFYEIQDDDTNEMIQPIIDAHNRSNPRKDCDKVHPEYDIYHQDGHCGSKIKNRIT